jgi:hypothetical protein
METVPAVAGAGAGDGAGAAAGAGTVDGEEPLFDPQAATSNTPLKFTMRVMQLPRR